MRASTIEGQRSSQSSHASGVALRPRPRAPQARQTPRPRPATPAAQRKGGPRWRILLPVGVASLWLASMLLPLPNIGAWLAHLRPAAASPAARAALRGATLDGVPAPDFQLRDQNGQPVSLAQFRGQPVVLTFFDSVCPHAECSLMAQYLEWSAQFLGADARRVAWVALSVNPWHDTPETARAFLTSHNVTLPLHYALGSVDQMSALWKAYHMQVILQSDGIVIHTTGVYVLDAEGRERVYLSEGFDPHDLSGDLRALLAQGGAGAATGAANPAAGTPQAGTRQTRTVDGYAVTLAARPGQFGTYTLDVTLADARGAPVTGAAVSAELTMTEMAMEPEHVVLAPQGPAGTYAAHNVLTMVGRWRATLRIQLATRPPVLPGLPAITPAPLTVPFDFTARYEG